MKSALAATLVSLTLALLAGCAADTGPTAGASAIVAGTGDLLVTASVVREITPTTTSEALTPAAGAHTHVELRRYVGEDAPAELVLADDQPFTGLPLNLTVRGDAARVFADRSKLLLFVSVLNHPGNDRRVGDLMSEYRNEVTAAGDSLTVKVSGLESCDAPGAGGFCTSAH